MKLLSKIYARLFPEPRFHYNQRVQVTGGFFKSHSGVVYDYTRKYFYFGPVYYYVRLNVQRCTLPERYLATDEAPPPEKEPVWTGLYRKEVRNKDEEVSHD